MRDSTDDPVIDGEFVVISDGKRHEPFFGPWRNMAAFIAFLLVLLLMRIGSEVSHQTKDYFWYLHPAERAHVIENVPFLKALFH